MLETIGRYKVLESMGTGGIGKTFRARDTQHGRTVALKVVANDIAADPERRARFLRDAHAAAALSHHNIATVFEIGEDAGELFLALEFVPGETLSALTVRGPLNARRAIDYATQLADALAEGHAREMVHGDVHPSNVIVTPKGSAKLLEFGMSSWTEGGRARGVRDDVGALGEVLREMVTGKSDRSAPRSRVSAHAQREGHLTSELDAIVSRMQAIGSDFNQSAATVAAELRALAEALDARQNAAVLPVAATLDAEPAPRGWWLLVAIAGLVALGVAWLALQS